MRLRSILAATLAVAALGTVNQADASTNRSYVHGRVILTAHRVVVRSTLPHCRWEDGGENQPCTWNVGHPKDGNGRGLAYWIDREDRAHYVWSTDPRHGAWHFLNRGWASAMHQSEPQRHIHWRACIVKVGDTTFIKCPNGARFSS